MVKYQNAVAIVLKQQKSAFNDVEKANYYGMCAVVCSDPSNTITIHTYTHSQISTSTYG